MSCICAACIHEPVLRELVVTASEDANRCDYCASNLPATDIGFIAQECDQVLKVFYELSSQTMAVVHFDRTPLGTDLETTIQRLVGVPERAVEDIAEELQFMWYDRDSGEYQYGDDEPWFVLKTSMESPLSDEWSVMESSLRSEARYLNPKVVQFMKSIFDDIADDVTVDGASVLVDAGPGSAYEQLFRARVFQSERSLIDALQHPERFIGAPLADIGASGRMNAAGLPAFYGATEAQTALAEVRPPVGSWVVIARFFALRPLKLLDLRLLSQILLREGVSLFDARTVAMAYRRDFLRALCEKMVAPVMPEYQDRNYLITQVVADYLAMHPRVSIDGIIYPSAQRKDGDSNESNGENVVLFHKAATAVDADTDEPTAHAELWDYEEDGPVQYFRPKIVYHPDKPKHGFRFRQLGFHPEPSLKLIRDSIAIHHVRSIDIRTDVTSVDVENPHSYCNG